MTQHQANKAWHDWLFIVVIVLLLVCKLVLVGANEIASASNDSINYVRQATVALGELGSLPGYPIWLAVSASLGLPQRVAIELLYLGSCMVLAFSLKRIFGRVTGALSFGALAFLPATFFLFDNALSDGFFSCMTVLALALSLDALADRNARSLAYWARQVVLALVLGWMLITRNEDLLAYSWILWLVAVQAFIQSSTASRSGVLMQALASLLVLASVAASIGIGVSLYHLKTQGVYARSIAGLPSHMELLLKLASIDTGTESINRVPVTKAQREAAYRASPSLNALKDKIEDPGNMYQQASLSAHLPPGEIGAGWVWHVFNDAAIQGLEHRTLKDLDIFYAKVNAELAQATARGEFKNRLVVHPFLGGNLHGAAARVVPSTLLVTGALFEAYKPQTDAGVQSATFDEACLRRTSLTHRGQRSLQAQGWAFVDKGALSITSVEIGAKTKVEGVEHTEWMTAQHFDRPDVMKSFAAEGSLLSAVYGFKASLLGLDQGELVARYFLSDGSHIVSPVLVVNRVDQVEDKPSGKRLTQGIDLAGPSDRPSSTSKRRQDVQVSLIKQFNRVAPWTAVSILSLGVLAALVRRRFPTARMDNLFYWSVVLVLGLLVQRIAFYGLVDAAGWDVEVRYMTAATGLLIVAVTIIAGVGLSTFMQLVFAPRQPKALH